MASYKPEVLFACNISELYDLGPGAWLLCDPKSWENLSTLDASGNMKIVHVRGNAWGMINVDTGWVLKLAGQYKIEKAIEKYGTGPEKRITSKIQESTESA